MNYVKNMLTYNIIYCIILYSKKQLKEAWNLVFNTGAALLDAIVLSVVSKDKDGTYGYKITQDEINTTNLMGIRLRRMCVRELKFRNPRCIRCCGVLKRMDA